MEVFRLEMDARERRAREGMQPLSLLQRVKHQADPSPADPGSGLGVLPPGRSGNRSPARPGPGGSSSVRAQAHGPGCGESRGCRGTQARLGWVGEMARHNQVCPCGWCGKHRAVFCPVGRVGERSGQQPGPGGEQL